MYRTRREEVSVVLSEHVGTDLKVPLQFLMVVAATITLAAPDADFATGETDKAITLTGTDLALSDKIVSSVFVVYRFVFPDPRVMINMSDSRKSLSVCIALVLRLTERSRARRSQMHRHSAWTLRLVHHWLQMVSPMRVTVRPATFLPQGNVNSLLFQRPRRTRCIFAPTLPVIAM